MKAQKTIKPQDKALGPEKVPASPIEPCINKPPTCRHQGNFKNALNTEVKQRNNMQAQACIVALSGTVYNSGMFCSALTAIDDPQVQLPSKDQSDFQVRAPEHDGLTISTPAYEC
jgi:hypothetical protein